MKTEWLYKCQEGASESTGQRHKNHFSSNSFQEEKILVKFNFFVPCLEVQKGGLQPVRMWNKNLKINLLMHQSTAPLII